MVVVHVWAEAGEVSDNANPARTLAMASDLVKNRIAQLWVQQVTRWQGPRVPGLLDYAGGGGGGGGGGTHCHCWIYFAYTNFRANAPLHETCSLVIKDHDQGRVPIGLFDNSTSYLITLTMKTTTTNSL